MELYPEAERFARMVELRADDTIESALDRWHEDITVAKRVRPSAGQVKAARRVLEARLSSDAPPLPPSSSSCAWKLEPLTFGLTQLDKSK